jgi:hypothetical protein
MGSARPPHGRSARKSRRYDLAAQIFLATWWSWQSITAHHPELAIHAQATARQAAVSIRIAGMARRQIVTPTDTSPSPWPEEVTPRRLGGSLSGCATRTCRTWHGGTSGDVRPLYLKTTASLEAEARRAWSARKTDKNSENVMQFQMLASY